MKEAKLGDAFRLTSFPRINKLIATGALLLILSTICLFVVYIHEGGFSPEPIAITPFKGM